MTKKKVLSIFGTRPEATKMAPVILELRRRGIFHAPVLVTAQHREMLDGVLNIFDITPDYDLNIMQHGQTLSDITIRALKGIEGVLKEAKPDMILVHGDTTTTFAAALAAFYAGVKLGHVEAGLRTYDKYQPYPEEMNRMLTTALADIYFAPTELSRKHLIKENIAPEKIFVTGNTSIDAVAYSIRENYRFECDALNTLDFTRPIITMTAHRNENLGEPLRAICRAVKRIAQDNPGITIVYAVHLNPLVQSTAREILSEVPNILLTSTLSMLDLHNLMRKSYLILTDSGGLQEEAPSFHKPVIVLRNVTERPEGLTAGTLLLAGNEEENIYNVTQNLLHNSVLYDKMAKAENPFGDGKASARIADAIEQLLR